MLLKRIEDEVNGQEPTRCMRLALNNVDERGPLIGVKEVRNRGLTLDYEVCFGFPAKSRDEEAFLRAFRLERRMMLGKSVIDITKELSA
jgi:hypothetical protein